MMLFSIFLYYSHIISVRFHRLMLYCSPFQEDVLSLYCVGYIFPPRLCESINNDELLTTILYIPYSLSYIYYFSDI
jgi:hypothetical protein